MLAAAKDAAFPPKQRHQLEGLQKRLENAFKLAEQHGAFTYAQQLPWGLLRLYIRHPGLWQEVRDKLHKVAADPSLQGVLITGARGMGKSTLARDVALSFQQGTHGGLESCEYLCTDGPPGNRRRGKGELGICTYRATSSQHHRSMYVHVFTCIALGVEQA